MSARTVITCRFEPRMMEQDIPVLVSNPPTVEEQLWLEYQREGLQAGMSVEESKRYADLMST